MIQKITTRKTELILDAWRYPCLAALGDAVREVVGTRRPRSVFLVADLVWKMRLAASLGGLNEIKLRVTKSKESGLICDSGLELLRRELVDAKSRIESNGPAVD